MDCGTPYCHTGMTISNVGVVIHSTVRALKAQLAAVAIICLLLGGLSWGVLAPEPMVLSPTHFEAPALPAPKTGPVIREQREALAYDEPELEESDELPPVQSPRKPASRRPKKGTAAPKRVMEHLPAAL